MDNQKNVLTLISKAEKIGVIGSPSTTSELTLDILGTAVTKKLVGELCLFHYPQDGANHYALGQITEIELKNIWMEDPTMRSIVRQKGQIDPISERQDTHIGKMNLSAIFKDEQDYYKPSILGTVPATGTPIYLVEDEIIDTILQQYKKEIFYLGHVYGSKPLLPLWFKHFDKGPSGAGEAYHLGIFGKTGSGKSVLAKMVLLGYARHSNMGIFILDPQGEFSKGFEQQNLFQSLEMEYILSNYTLKTFKKNVLVFDLHKIALNRWDLFGELLIEFKFFFELGIKFGDYQTIAAEYLLDYIRGNNKIKFSTITDNNILLDCLQFLYDKIDHIYSGKQYIDKIQETIQDNLRKISKNQQTRISNIWEKVANLFVPGQYKKSPNEIIKQALFNNKEVNKPFIIIDLSKKPNEIAQYVWDEKIKPLIIDSFLDELIRIADRVYHENESLNTLVVLDEAHRLAPKGRIDNQRKDRIRSRLIDAIRTTRKYGLGWMFISQTISSLDRAIIDQLRIYFFGFGLSMGMEYQALEEIAGGDKNSLKLYRSFRDPHSAFDQKSKEYPFMTVGPVSPLSFAGTPLFFTAFNKPEDFIVANKLMGSKT